MLGGIKAEYSPDYFSRGKHHAFGFGGALYELNENIKKFKEDVRHKALTRIISDLAARIPSPVSAAVSKEYAVGKLAAIKRRQASDGKRQMLTSRGNTAVKIRYESDDEAQIVFSGSHFDGWPVWANSQKKVPKLRKTKSGKRVRKPYKVYREIIRGKRVEIKADPPTQIFVQGQTGQLRIFARTPPQNNPLLLGSTSIPQAIAQPRTIKVWAPKVNELICKRVEHHLQLAAKSKK